MQPERLLRQQASKASCLGPMERDLHRHWVKGDSQKCEQQEQATAHPADDPVGQAPVMLQQVRGRLGSTSTVHTQEQATALQTCRIQSASMVQQVRGRSSHRCDCTFTAAGH